MEDLVRDNKEEILFRIAFLQNLVEACFNLAGRQGMPLDKASDFDELGRKLRSLLVLETKKFLAINNARLIEANQEMERVNGQLSKLVMEQDEIENALAALNGMVRMLEGLVSIAV